MIPLINDYGYRFSSIYFLAVILLCWAYVFSQAVKNQLFIKRKYTWEILAFMLLLLLSANATDQLRYSKPLFFLSVIITVFAITKVGKIQMPLRSVKVMALLFVLISLMFVPFSSNYTFDDRFVAFLIAPTVFSVNADAFLVLFLGSVRSKLAKVILVFLFFFLIYLSKTRINLLVTFAIPILFFLLERGYFSRRAILITTIFIFVFVYPLYQYAMEAGYFGNFLMLRYSDNRDASFDMRYYLHAVSFDLFQSGTIMEKLFGHGSEFSRLFILDLTHEDSYSHNDFLRLMIDFGVIFTALFIGVMTKIASKSNMATILFLVYLSSFYHNMVFEFFLPCLIIFYSNAESEFKGKHQLESTKTL